MVVAGLVQAQVVVPPQAQVQSDRWYALKINGQTAGWQHEVTYRFNDRIISASASKMVIRRGAESVAMRSGQLFEEAPGGEPIRAVSTMNAGQTPVKQTMTFLPDGSREWVLEQGSQVIRKTLPKIEGDWHTPAQADAVIEHALRQEAAEFSTRTIDLSMGTEPSEMVLTPDVQIVTNVNGQQVAAHKLDGRVDAGASGSMPIKLVVDKQGQLLTSSMQLGGMTIESEWADETVMTDGFASPELMTSLMVKPEAKIDSPRKLKRAIYELTLPEGVDAEPASAGQQTVERLGPGRFRVTVFRDEAHGERAAAVDSSFLASSMTIQKDDPVIADRCVWALKNQKNDMTATPDLFRSFVHQHMEVKDLSVGFATASEAARTGQGDCTEHAVLLAAMLRHKNIPARVVTGLLYVEEFAGKRDVFGYHMWTQAYIKDVKGEGGRWIDLDAMLPGYQNFDAAHIALSVSDLNDANIGQDMLAMMPFLGGLEIQVVEIEW